MLLFLLLCSILFQATLAINNGLAVTPQMAWNSWSHYFCSVTETIFRENADAIISSGLAAHGYNYINLDDCWAAYRNANGTIHSDPKTFPSGIAALSDYVHSRGLKILGVYGLGVQDVRRAAGVAWL